MEKELNKIYYLNPEEANELKFLNGNRQVNNNHARKLSLDLMKTGGRYFPPILVDGNTNIVIDGQHRLTAYRICWNNKKNNFNEPIKVIYNNYDTNILSQIVKMNTQQRCWKIDDYLFSQSNTENAESIKLLNDFCQSHPRLVTAGNKNKLNYNYANTILCGSRCTAAIKNGTYKITQQQIDFGEILYKELDEILNKLQINYMNFWVEKLYSGYYQFRHNSIIKKQFENIDFNKFLNCISELPSNYDRLSTNDWLNYFSLVLQDCIDN